MEEGRNLDLMPRQEETRDKINLPSIVKFPLIEIKTHFDENLQYIKSQFDIADELFQHEREEEAQKIWSSQIVFLESAFDFYLHEITKYGLSEMFAGNWDKTEKYSKLSVKMSIVDKALNEREDTDWFFEYVNGFYRELTLVSYKSFKGQMKLLGINIQEIADTVFYERESNIKTRTKLEKCLNILYRKRNIIAHQSGRRHSDAQREDITKDMVEQFIRDIEKIVQEIQELAKQKD